MKKKYTLGWYKIEKTLISKRIKMSLFALIKEWWRCGRTIEDMIALEKMFEFVEQTFNCFCGGVVA